MRQQPLRQPVDAAGRGIMYEADMAAAAVDFQGHRGGQTFAARDRRDRQERVVGSVQQQRRGAYRGQQRTCAAARVVVAGAKEAVQGRGDGIVELVERARAQDALAVGDARKARELLDRKSVV